MGLTHPSYPQSVCVCFGGWLRARLRIGQLVSSVLLETVTGSVISLWSNRVQLQDFLWNSPKTEALFCVAGYLFGGLVLLGTPNRRLQPAQRMARPADAVGEDIW